MSRQSLAWLAFECRRAAHDYPIGSDWRHYGGDVYIITGFGIRESTGEVEVEYRPAEPLGMGDQLVLQRIGDMRPDLRNLVFHRPLSDWDEIVTVSRGDLLTQAQIDALTPEEKLAAANDKKEVRRFARIYRQEHWSDER